MKKLSIYNVYVLIESDQDYLRILDLCKINNLPCDCGYCLDYIFKYFRFRSEFINDIFNQFSLSDYTNNFTRVSEQEFIKLLKEHKNEP